MLDLFLYPLTDVDLLAWRRQEVEALRRSLEADQEGEKIGWALRAIRAAKELLCDQSGRASLSLKTGQIESRCFGTAIS